MREGRERPSGTHVRLFPFCTRQGSFSGCLWSVGLPLFVNVSIFYLLWVAMMHTPVSSPLLPVRVLFLSRNESSVRTATKLLRSLGISSLTHLGDSSQALAFLEKQLTDFHESAEQHNPRPEAENVVGIVICDERLADVPASVFLYSLAKHPALQSQPVMVLTGTAESSRRLRAAGVYLLERPYTAQDLARMMRKAMSPVRRVLNASVFESIAEQKGIVLQPKQRKQKSENGPPVTTSDWYKKGMARLQKSELREAEHAFVRVLDRQEDHIDASLGLARVYHAKGEEKETHRYLLRAAAISLRSGDRVLAARITGMLPASMRDNVFVHEALTRMETGEYKAAALGFLDAGKESAEVPLHHLISRACLRLPEPDESMKKLCRAFSNMGYKVTADRLRQRLLVYPEFEPDDEPRSWLDAYPKLKEAVNVVSYTTWAWRHANV